MCQSRRVTQPNLLNYFGVAHGCRVRYASLDWLGEASRTTYVRFPLPTRVTEAR